MNKYEITIITSEDLKDTPVKKEIEALSGKVLTVNAVGQRQLTYKIKGQQTGFFTSILFELESTKVLELVNKLNLNSEIIRSLVITAPPAKMVAKKEEKETKKTELEIAPEILPAPANLSDVALAKSEEVKPETVKEAIREIDEARDEEIKKIDEKPAKEKVEKAPEIKIAKPEKAVKPKEESKVSSEIAAEELSSEDRLKALDKKLDELLKE